MIWEGFQGYQGKTIFSHELFDIGKKFFFSISVCVTIVVIVINVL